MKIKGYAVFEPKGELKPWSYDPKRLEDYDVEIEVMYCGVCGSDIHAIDNGWNKTTYPLVPGHEAVGRVSIVGARVANVAVGDVIGVGPRCYSCLDCSTCNSRLDQHCPKAVSTYGGKYPDGYISRGGYASRMIVSSTHVFKIPPDLPLEKVAPLLCAGITVYTPLLSYSRDSTGTLRKRLGVVGIGGLGHLAIQFAKAMGYWVVAISHSAHKKEDAIKLGADEFLFSGSPEQRESCAKTLDMVLCTSYGTESGIKIYLDLLVVGGTFVLLAVPETPVEFDAKDIVFRSLHVKGSLIGSRQDIPSMLEFAAKHQILPMVEMFPMDQANQALAKFRKGQIKYRAVLLAAPHE